MQRLPPLEEGRLTSSALEYTGGLLSVIKLSVVDGNYVHVVSVPIPPFLHAFTMKPLTGDTSRAILEPTGYCLTMI